MNKEKKLFIGGVLLLLLTVVTCYSVSGTYAKYASEVTGTDSATVASWAWNINGTDMDNTTTTFAMDDLFAGGKIYELESDACTTTVDDQVKQATDTDIVAPGTCGKVTIVVKNNSEVDATYAYTLSETNTNNIPIKYSLTGEAGSWKTISELNAANAEADILMSDNTKNVDLYWKWDFNGADATDTPLGIGGTATVELTATLKLAQKD